MFYICFKVGFMQTKSTSTIPITRRPFFKKNWYKVLLAGVILYGVNQRDLSFELNLRSPFPAEEPQLQPAPVAQPQKAKREKFTEQVPNAAGGMAANSEQKNVFDLFSNPGKGSLSLQEQLQKIPEKDQLEYLKRFARVAISERKKFGVPSSIILANALLFSQAGQSAMLEPTNNHFGLTCTQNWSGESLKQGQTCWRVYDNAWSSYRDFSQFLSSQEQLARLPEHDYQAWSESLARLKILPEPNLEETLVELIEYFNLAELDKK